MQEALKERDEELEQKDSKLVDLQQQLSEASEEVKALAAQIDEERAKARALPKPAKVSSCLMFNRRRALY